MPSHPDRVRRSYSQVPLEIAKRYMSGEREIAVSRATYMQYDAAVIANYRTGRGPSVGTPCLMFKDARVTMMK